MNSTQTPLLTVPLGREAHRLAGQFAAGQATIEQGKRVYLNTLSVYAVHSYLKWLQIETDLSQSDSWQLGIQAIFDSTDLVIPGVGKLECRPVLPEETRFSLPSEMSEDRIGYVAVQFRESLDEVQLLGFALPVNASELPIADLQPLHTLLDYIPDVVPASTTSKIPILRSWLENSFEAGWQTLKELFSTQAAHPAFSMRSAERPSDIENPEASVSKGKLIDLGIQLAGHPFALIVTLKPAEIGDEMDIRLQIYPTGRQIYLPPSLQMIVLDESGATCLETEARSADNWIQLEFSGQPGEQFSVKVALEDISITENFVI